jgi:succinate dehydrogenase/fumarate reductase flavoprotein subunit
MVSGGRAGDAAGQEAKRRASLQRVNEGQIEEERKRIEELFARKNNDNLGPRRVKTHLNRLMWDFVGLIRSGEGLEKALADFQRMEEEDLPRITLATPSRRYNREFIETLELSNLLKVARAVSTPALQRIESRGAHFRQDYPKWDNRNWLKHLRVSQKNGNLQLEDGPVDLSEMKPPGD